MRKISLILVCIVTGIQVLNAQSGFQQDFEEFSGIIEKNYAYLDKKEIDWQRVYNYYLPQSKEIKSKEEFVRFLEKVCNELYDAHVSLNVNLASSNRLIPSGSDLLIEKIDRSFFVKDCRYLSAAYYAGLRPGTEIISYNGLAIEQQLLQFLPRTVSSYNETMISYAANMLLAGTHDRTRKITVRKGQKLTDYFPDGFKSTFDGRLISSKWVDSGVVLLRVGNSLSNYELVEAFDKELDKYLQAQAIILDLTETASGGNTVNARAILGRFTDMRYPYQVHERDEKEFGTTRFWMEYITPRKCPYLGRLYVMVGPWTGSMGEGIAIGFDALKNASIVGTRMAGLLGAIEKFTLPYSKISFQIPTERILHVNLQPREDFLPAYLTDNLESTIMKIGELLNIKNREWYFK